MAQIKKAKPKESSGGYERLFGIADLGKLISRVQSAVISSGSELERIIIHRVNKIKDLDKFLKQDIMQDGVFIAPKHQVKKCKTLQFPEGEPDFLVFKRRNNKQVCLVVELKDGHQFDTKKASAERGAIHSFIERNARYLQYTVSCHFCCFNQDSRDAIVTGFKNKITEQEALTGREFCEILELDYDEIVNHRKQHQPENVTYFLGELVKIEPVRNMLKKLLKNGED